MKYTEELQKSIAFSITQMPHSENEHVAVVEGVLFDGQVMHKDIGVATAKSAESNQIDVILNQARADAEQRLMRGKNLLFAPQPMPFEDMQDYPPARSQQKQADTVSRANMNGGGNKQATERQKDMILNICEDKGVNPEAVCQRVTKASFSTLRGQDAHKVIQYLTAK